MNIHEILDRLEKVKSNGADKWIACCPAHDDKTPSLAIKDLGERVLLHDFGGCTAEEICTAIGIGLHDLFIDAKQPRQIAPGVSRKQLADALETELLVLAQCAHKRAHNATFTDEEINRERLAWRRVDTAREVAR